MSDLSQVGCWMRKEREEPSRRDLPSFYAFCTPEYSPLPRCHPFLSPVIADPGTISCLLLGGAPSSETQLKGISAALCYSLYAGSALAQNKLSELVVMPARSHHLLHSLVTLTSIVRDVLIEGAL